MPDRIAYLVLAHRAPAQAAALIRELASPRAAFYVHIDRGAPTSVARSIRDAVSDIPGIRFLPRRATPWASFALVEATLRCLEAVEADTVPYSHAVLLSGQDYPIVPRAQVEEQLAAHTGISFLEWHEMPYWGDSHQRLRHWHLRTRHLHLRIPARRRVPAPVAPVRGGSEWWCLARDDVRHVLEVVRRHPDVLRYFRHTDVSDETFFQTLVLSRVGAKVINDDMRFIRWPDAPHPETLTAADIDDMAASKKLFARKFDEDLHPGVLEQVRRRLLDR